MADEMDESLNAEEKGPNPEEAMHEGVKASSAAGKEDELAASEAASQEADGESSREAEAPGAEVSPSVASVSAASTAPAAGKTERPPSAVASSTDSTEALYDAAPNVDPAPHAARAATRSEGTPRVEVGELDKPGLDLLYDVELDATLQFGSKEMLLRDVLELGPGDVVELDRHIAQPVDLVVGDRIVARGEVVVASGNFALRVTEVATPQMRLESIRCLF
jgi:flagellar motor switch protein FliN